MFDMNVQECIDHLAASELSNSGWMDLSAGTFEEQRIPQLLVLMNEALQKLYTRFLLKESALFVELQENKTEYILSKDHITQGFDCEKHPGMPDYNRYIRPMSGKPFENDIIKILSVTLPNGIQLPLNNPSEQFSVYTPSYNVLQVPLPYAHGVVAVAYQANHFKLDEENLDRELELPESLYGAFFAYVAYLVYGNINTSESVQNSQKYYAMFNELLNDNLLSDAYSQSTVQTNVKFQMNGWC